MREIRIAKTSEGLLYMVQQIDAHNIVHCWGEVTGYRGLKVKHGPTKRFPKATVTISLMERTPELIDTLGKQYLKGLQKQGHTIQVTGRKVKTYVILPKESSL